MIDALDLEVSSPSSWGEPWRLSFEGRPKRTDSPSNPVSRFQGRAEFGPFPPGGIRNEVGTLARLNLTAEGALVEDLLKVSVGNDYGVHGSLNLHLHLAGTTSLLRMSGTAELKDLHGWDRLPSPAAPVVRASVLAVLDLEGETFDLQSLAIPVSAGSILLEGQISELFHHPLPNLRAQLRRVALADIVAITKQFSSGLDSRLVAQGMLDGQLQLEGSPVNVVGSLSVSDSMLHQTGTQQTARLSDFMVVLDGTTAQVGPLNISLEKGRELTSTVKWIFSKRELTVQLEGEALPLDSFSSWFRAFGSRWGAANFAKGNLALSVTISSRKQNPSEVVGWAQISEALLQSAAVNQPIQVPNAWLQFQPGTVRVKSLSAILGALELRGGLVATLPSPPPESRASASPHLLPRIEFDLQVPNIDLGDLDRLLNPRYRPGSFFRFQGSQEKDISFFATLAARGTIEAGLVSYRTSAISNVKASLNFHDRTLEIRSFVGEFAGGTQSGEATIQFGQGTRLFRIQSRFTNVDLNQLTKPSPSWSGYFSGKLSGKLRLSGFGWDLSEILNHLGGSGEATGANLEVSGMGLVRNADGESDSTTRISSLSSAFQIAKKRVQITDMKVFPASPRPKASALLLITGAVGFDRSLDLLVRGKTADSPYHWGGTLAEPVVGEAPTASASLPLVSRPTHD